MKTFSNIPAATMQLLYVLMVKVLVQLCTGCCNKHPGSQACPGPTPKPISMPKPMPNRRCPGDRSCKINNFPNPMPGEKTKSACIDRYGKTRQAGENWSEAHDCNSCRCFCSSKKKGPRCMCTRMGCSAFKNRE